MKTTPIIRRCLQPIERLDSIRLDARRLQESRCYDVANFNERFLPGQGTEDILATIAEARTDLDWLDVGAGSSSLFWSIGLRTPRPLIVADNHPEPLSGLANYVSSGDYPRCYFEACEMFGKSISHVEHMATSLRGFCLFDALSGEPPALPDTPELITQFGLLGLCRDAKHFRVAFGQLARLLGESGESIGANWIWTPRRAAAMGRQNSWLTASLVRECIEGVGMRALKIKRIPIARDPEFSAIVLYHCIK